MQNLELHFFCYFFRERKRTTKRYLTTHQTHRVFLIPQSLEYMLAIIQRIDVKLGNDLHNSIRDLHDLFSPGKGIGKVKSISFYLSFQSQITRQI